MFPVSGPAFSRPTLGPLRCPLRGSPARPASREVPWGGGPKGFSHSGPAGGNVWGERGCGEDLFVATESVDPDQGGGKGQPEPYVSLIHPATANLFRDPLEEILWRLSLD